MSNQDTSSGLADDLASQFKASPAFVHAVLELVVPGWRSYGSASALYEEHPASKTYVGYALSSLWRGQKTVERIKGYWQPKGNNALDIGCGSGGVILAMKQQGFSVTGMELDPELAKLSKVATAGLSDVKIMNADILKCDLASLGKFDVITCNAVIEHVANPERLLQVIESLLNDQGVIHIEIPNKDCITSIASDLHYQQFGLALFPHSGAVMLHGRTHGNKVYGCGDFFDLGWYKSRLLRLGIETEVVTDVLTSWFETALADLDRLWDAFMKWSNQPVSDDEYLIRGEIRQRFLDYFSRACADLRAAHDGDPQAFETRYGAQSWILLGHKM
jgi:2-polyprenyl-3-methyl-5-hydroxy-6-metoxy-1,4-benzoquinol methylase